MLTMFRGEVEPIRDEILYDIANLEGMNLTINVPNTWPNGTLEVKCEQGCQDMWFGYAPTYM